MYRKCDREELYCLLSSNDLFFFFQAEDGIRDYKVTGVQTCALPILREPDVEHAVGAEQRRRVLHHVPRGEAAQDRKSTRLNSSHLVISYAVFCLKKKKKLCHYAHAPFREERRADRVCISNGAHYSHRNL